MLLATGYKAENIREYRYFDKATKSLDFAGMTADLEVRKFHWYSLHVDVIRWLEDLRNMTV